MVRGLRNLLGLLAAAASLLLAAATVRAEQGSLELKRLGPSTRAFLSGPGDYLYRATYPQHFFQQMGIKGVRTAPNPGADEFAKLVKKEPAYESEYPFRGVAKLGSEQYLFVFDSVAPEKNKAAKPKSSKAEAAKDASDQAAAEKDEAKKDEKEGQEKPEPTKSYGYNRLYFDFNHNGDLTDDKPVSPPDSNWFSSSNYVRYEYPRIDVTLDVEGKKVDYAFFFSVYSTMLADFKYANASLNAAAYREGKITLDGKDHRIVLLDFNSNGRFDDAWKVDESVHTEEGQVVARQGDQILLDLNSADLVGSPYELTAGPDRYPVGRLIRVDDRYYDLKVSPAGDQITMTPSKTEVGFVTNPNERFRAVVYSDQGFLKISGEASKPLPLPEGQWKLLSYTIEQTDEPKKEKPSAEKKDGQKAEEGTSLLKALSDALIGGPVRQAAASRGPTLVTASARQDYKPVMVRKGETTQLPFGPPYKPTVRVQYLSKDQANLSLSVVGSTGEVCSDMQIRGTRPSEKPSFTIANAKGEVIERGSFEYG